MLTHPTHERLITLGLTGMAKALEEQRRSPDLEALSFEERVGLLVDREAAERDTKRLATRLKFAALRQSACVEDVDWRTPRGIDRAVFAKLTPSICYMGHVTMENRHGLAVAGIVTHASGTAERRAAEIMLEAEGRKAGRRITAGADKAYDTADHVANLRAIDVTPHVTQNNGMGKTSRRRRSAIDARTTRHQGYGMSQTRRAMIECIFGWGKQHGTMRRTKHRGICRVAADFMLNLIAYNLIRVPKLVTT